jgi:hypothetical protein
MSSLSRIELLSLAIILELMLRDDSIPMPYPGPETEKDNCNHALCKECGGKCCKNVGCTFSPQDFMKLSPERKLTPEVILNEVKKRIHHARIIRRRSILRRRFHLGP